MGDACSSRIDLHSMVCHLMFELLFLQFSAAGILGIGIWTLSAKNDYEALLGSVMYMSSAGMMIAAGLFGMFVCIFGIIGAIRNSRFMILGVRCFPPI